MSEAKAAAPVTLKGKVLRPFFYKGEVQKVGTVLTFPKVFALELKAANKFAIDEAEEVEEVTKAPVRTSTAKTKEGDKDAVK